MRMELYGKFNTFQINVFNLKQMETLLYDRTSMALLSTFQRPQNNSKL